MIDFKEFIKLKDFLYRKTGIYIEDKRYELFSKKLDTYFFEHDFDNFRDFFHTLRFGVNHLIFQDLINFITINETYFFREKNHFEVLIESVLPKIIALKKENETIRILCAPSSTGEEPYSIALSLLDEKYMLANHDIELVGIDINNEVIRKASEGIFNKRSIQFVSNHLLNTYFSYEDEHFCINPTLKNAINFRVANVMDKIQMNQLGKFDIIFSRNMLIYFDDESRREVGITFYDLLKPNGFIFLGHADKMSKISSLFNTVKIGDALIYQKN